MKKLMTMIGVAAAAFGLQAEQLHGIGFEAGDPGVPTDEESGAVVEGALDLTVVPRGFQNPLWYTEAADLTANVTLYKAEEKKPTPLTDWDQNAYLTLEADAPLYRAIVETGASGLVPTSIETADRGGIIFNQNVKFSAFEDDPADLGDAKIAVWVKTVQEENGEDEAINHLMISTAALDSDVFSPTLTNIDTEVEVDVANWHQLKITAIQAATADGEPVPGFVVELDGVEIAKADGLFPAIAPVTYTAQGAELIAAKKLFPSMIEVGQGGADTLQGIAFKGTGAIDDITVAAAPVYTPPTTDVAAIGDTGYPTIEEAIEAVQDDETITLLADLTATVVVPAGKKFTLDFNNHGLTTNWGIQNCGTLTIVNGKINTIESSVVLYGGSVTTIESGTFTATDNAVITGQGNAQNKNVTLTINGGTFNGSITTAGYIACGVYVANSGTYAINGGTFNITNGCGICARAGQVTVAGKATFNVTGSITGKVGDKNVAIPCVAMYIDYSEPPYPGYDAKTDFLKAEVNTLSIADGFEWAGPVDGLYTLQAKKADEPKDPEKPFDPPAGKTAAEYAKELNGNLEALKAIVKAPECVTGSDVDAYKACFKAVVSGDQVMLVLDEDAAKATIVPELNDAEAAIVDNFDGGEVTITVIPGLYYGIAATAEVGAVKTAQPVWTQATSANKNSFKLAVPEVKVGDAKSDKAFFQVKCTDVPVTK